MPMPSTIPGAGLHIRNRPATIVPLVGVSIEAEISGLCARVAVAHRYVNQETTPIEAVYVFPLDEGAAVCGFEAVVDGTLVVGEVQERDKAFETYDDALAQGHGAFLLDEERPDVFQASVGNLPPGKEVLVRLTYVAELSVDEGRLRFTIPTTVSPRYAPRQDQTGPGRPDSEALNPPASWNVPYGLDLSVRLSMPCPITGIESPSHPISVSLNGCDAAVRITQGAALDRDFVLSIDAIELNSPQAWIERDDEGREAVAVAFVPTTPETTSPAEIIFVVDRSGSMEGTSIDEVRNALQLCLRSMISGCWFNIIGFGNTYESLFSGSRAYDQESLDVASQHVARMEANLGGTEILPALRSALGQAPHHGLPRNVVLLTDGQVTNTDAVLALGKAHASNTRIFTFGIGTGASHHLVKGLARAAGGAAEFIYPGERIESKVVRQFGRLLSPAIDDVTVEWIGGAVSQAPLNMPPLFAGGRALTYALIKTERPTAVRLSATSATGPLTFEVPLEGVHQTTGRTVATLAARTRIRELEESGDWLPVGGSQQSARRQGVLARELVELSIRYGIVSRGTSFVAVERRDTPVHGDIQLRRVPIALPTGWRSPLAVPSCVRGARPGSYRNQDVDHLSDLTLGVPVGMSDPSTQPASSPGRAARPGVFATLRGAWREARQRPSGMDALVALQSADGSWELSPQLAAILGRGLRDLESLLPGGAGAPPLMRKAWATALALAWLELYAPVQQDQWRLLASKARKWLADVAAAAPSGAAWADLASRELAGV